MAGFDFFLNFLAFMECSETHIDIHSPDLSNIKKYCVQEMFVTWNLGISLFGKNIIDFP